MSNHKFIYSILFSHRIILFLGIVILFSGCANEDEPEQGPVNRTVLIYMLSNNNLGSTYRFDTQNINDMFTSRCIGRSKWRKSHYLPRRIRYKSPAYTD